MNTADIYNPNTKQTLYQAKYDTLPTGFQLASNQTGPSVLTNQVTPSMSQYAQGPTITPNVPISTSTISSATQPFVTAPAAIPTAGAGVAGAVTAAQQGTQSYMDKTVADAKAAEAARVAAEKTALDTSKQSLVDRLLNRPTKSGLESTAYSTINDTGSSVNSSLKELNDINNQLLSEQTSSRHQVEALQKAGGTAGGIALQASQIQKDSLSRQADLAVIQQAKQNNYALAKDIADKKVTALLEDDKNKIDALTFQYKENKEQFTKDEQRQVEASITAETRAYEEKKVNLKTISDLAIKALEYGAPASIGLQMQKAKTPEEALSIGGSYLKDSKRELEIAKLRNEVASNAPVTGEWASVINGASGLVANTKKGTVRTNIANAITSGDYKTAYAEVANAVSDGLTGSNKTKFDDSVTDIGVMKGMRDAIKAYTDAGGNVGYLKGSADGIAKNFGQLSTDPKFAALAVQLQREFQSYRNSMTGAAFTPAESKEYEKVNPRSNASLDLNLATIDGAVAQLSNRVDSTIATRLPDAKKIKDKVKQQEASTQDAKTQVIDLGKNNPQLQGQIKTLVTQNDPTLGRPLTYDEVLQVIGSAVGKY